MAAIVSHMSLTQALSLPPASRPQFEARFRMWQRMGVSARAASVLALAACDTVEEVRRLGRRYFAGYDNVGPTTLSELTRLAGWKSEVTTAEDAVVAALRLAIGNKDGARDVARDILMSLRRAGFVVLSRRNPR